ncbi:hypothetical protein J1614_008783 [Plenodomus biglobosus]|nr:hypothetical protein J1614_008783 [Plenodomus biglobosus]
MSDTILKSRICSCEDDATATTSKGDPPPDPALESWLSGAWLLLAPAVGEGATFVGCADVANVSVAPGSTTKPPVDWLAFGRLDGFASAVSDVDDDDDAAAVPVDSTISNDEVAVVIAASVLVSTDTRVVVALVVLELLVVTLTPGHSALGPRPFWKTPMMETSLTSTPAQPFETAISILARPCTHAALQTAVDPSVEVKSLATQPSILELYTAAHCEGRLSMRGVKLERLIVAEVVLASTVRPRIAMRSVEKPIARSLWNVVGGLRIRPRSVVRDADVGTPLGKVCESD